MPGEPRSLENQIKGVGESQYTSRTPGGEMLMGRRGGRGMRSANERMRGMRKKAQKKGRERGGATICKLCNGKGIRREAKREKTIRSASHKKVPKNWRARP